MSSRVLTELIQNIEGRLAHEDSFPQIPESDMTGLVDFFQQLKREGVVGRALREQILVRMRELGYANFLGDQAEYLIPLLDAKVKLREIKL